MDPELVIPEWRRPDRPLLVFDGDCAFCRQWVRRWRGITGERVAYRPAQEVAGQFPEIGPERFGQKVWLIEPDGRATGGAAAVVRLYALVGEKPAVRWLYEHSPACAAVAEGAYAWVARHRGGLATATRWLWGDVSQRPRYGRMRSIFLRGMGLTYLAAFWSLGVQVDGLLGRRGILPAAEFLETVRLFLGPRGYRLFPTLLWLDSSDRALHLLCWGGVALSGLLIAGVLPGACAVLLWVFYLSLTVAGQDFLGFQWDSLLLEAGLLAILFAPWGLRLDGARREPSHLVVGLIRWLVFRVMFLSGVVKLASGDPTWRAWDALRFHYETQPLPTWTSWYAHQGPEWFQKLSVGWMFWAELLAPLLVFAPRRLRWVAFGSIVLLQVQIVATGNFGFFNLLTIVLCVALVEDRDWGRRAAEGTPAVPEGWPRRVVVGAAGAVIALVTTLEAIDATPWTFPFPEPLPALQQAVRPLRSMNAYGLFAVMTTERPEIVVEGSADGMTWRPYAFRWKPGAVDRRPRFCTPHMPRLDWQMWFAALAGDCRAQPWFLRFEARLLEGSPSVLALLSEDPFPGRPPRFVRARLDRYRFTRWGASTWWQREDLGLYCPPLEGRDDSGPPSP